MKVIIKHCPPWGTSCTQIVYIDTNETVETLQEQIEQKFQIANSKQILKFQRDGIKFKLIPGWSLSHYGIEEGNVVSLEVSHPDIAAEFTKKKLRSVQGKGEYFSKLGIIDRKSEEVEEEVEFPYKYGRLSHGPNHHSLLSTSDTTHDNDYLGFETRSQSGGNISISSYKGHQSKNIKDVVVRVIKETRNSNFKGVLDILDAEHCEIEEGEDGMEGSKEYHKFEAKDIINEKGESGWNVFHWSVFLGKQEICAELLKRGACPSMKTTDNWTPLQLAVHKNNIEVAKLLLTQPGVNINEITEKGTALHIAVKNGKHPMVSLLLTHGANCSIEIPNEGTVYEIAPSCKIKELINSSLIKSLAEAKEEGAPSTFPIIKGWMFSKGDFLFQMCPRYFVINPEEGTFARYRKSEDYPDRPREIIPLKDIAAVQRKKPDLFCNKSLHYLELQYEKKYTMACNNEDVANQWLYYIVQGSIYSTYMDEMLQKESKDRLVFVKSCIRRDFQKEIELCDKPIEELKTDHLSNKRTRAETCSSLNDFLPSSSNEQHEVLNQESCGKELEQTQDSEVNLDSFEILKPLGSGSFGQVFQVEKRCDKKIYALKAIKINSKKDEQPSCFFVESNILKKIQHPFIVNIHDTFQTNQYYYLVLDFCSRGDLAKYLSMRGKLQEAEARNLIAELILAVEYLHSLNIIFRDLKPENILLNADGHMKLTDFGLAKEGINDDDVARSFCGSPAYMPPELLFNKGFSKAGDIYGIGAILYEMLIGKPPFYSEQIPILYSYIKNATLQFPSFVSNDAKDLLQKLLERDPKKRLGAQNKSEIKKHVFFKDFDWEAHRKRTQLSPVKKIP